MNEKQQQAVRMLFDLNDEEAARELEISQEEIDAWRRDPEFARATAEKLKENRQTACRVISAVMVEICRELASLFRGGGDPARIKLLVDVVKAAGLFKCAGEAESLDGSETDGLQALLERLGGDGDEAEPGEAD